VVADDEDDEKARVAVDKGEHHIGSILHKSLSPQAAAGVMPWASFTRLMMMYVLNSGQSEIGSAGDGCWRI
jgi:hypothetical protein